MSNRRPIALAASALVLLAAAACAAKYVPSEGMRSFKATLDPVDASNIVARAVGRSPAAAGLCKAPFRFDDPKPTANMDAFSVQAWRAGEELGRRQEGGRTVISYKKVAYVEERLFRDIKKIRITRDARGMCAGPVAPGQAAITLHSGGVAIPLVVAVANGELDSVLAALSVLAPQAELVEGAGL